MYLNYVHIFITDNNATSHTLTPLNHELYGPHHVTDELSDEQLERHLIYHVPDRSCPHDVTDRLRQSLPSNLVLKASSVNSSVSVSPFDCLALATPGVIYIKYSLLITIYMLTCCSQSYIIL